ESILANDGENFEILISDDASPGIAAIEKAVHPFLSRPNIRFHRQTTNLGEPENRNFLVAQARGQYNVILCDDDCLMPHALCTLRSYITRMPDQDLFLFGYQVVDACGRQCYTRCAPEPLLISLDDPRLIQRMLEGTWLPYLICHPSTY